MFVRFPPLGHVDAQPALSRARITTRRADSLCVFIMSSPFQVSIVLMAESFREANHLSQSSEGVAVICFVGALHTVSSASPGSVGWRSRSAFGPPPAGSSLSSSKEIRPKQTKRGMREVSCRPSSTNHGRSSFFQNSSRLRVRIDPIVAVLYFLQSVLFDT